MDPAHALSPRPAQQLHQHRLRLVIQRVRSQHRIGVPLRDQPGKALVAHGSRGFLDGLRLTLLAAPGHPLRHAGMVNVQRHLKPPAQLLHEGEVRICLVAAQSVVDVHRRQSYPQRMAGHRIGRMQQQQQCYRIRASGDSGAHPISRSDVFAVQRRRGGWHRDSILPPPLQTGRRSRRRAHVALPQVRLRYACWMAETRRATVSDAEAIGEQRVRMFVDDGVADRGNMAQMRANFVEWVRPKLEDGSYVGWLVEEDGRLVAGAGLWGMEGPPHFMDEDSRRTYLLNFYVA